MRISIIPTIFPVDHREKGSDRMTYSYYDLIVSHRQSETHRGGAVGPLENLAVAQHGVLHHHEGRRSHESRDNLVCVSGATETASCKNNPKSYFQSWKLQFMKQLYVAYSEPASGGS